MTVTKMPVTSKPVTSKAVTSKAVTSKPVTSKPVTQRRRYAVAGTGHRAWMYIDAILGEHADVAELVAWCEPNPTRIDYYDALVAERGGAAALPRYAPDAREQMIDALLVAQPLEGVRGVARQGCRTITGAV